MAAVQDASTRVGQIPEILSHIFSYLENQFKTLYSVIQVNKTWFDCGVPVMWAYASFGHLITLPQNRRQIYASQPRVLVITAGMPQYHSLLKNLKFPRARRVYIESYSRHPDFRDRPPITQYLPPTLEDLVLLSDDFGKGVFAVLKACRNLKAIRVDIADNLVTQDELVDFFRNSPALEKIDLIVGPRMDDWMSDEFLSHFGTRQNLKFLTLPFPVLEPMMRKMVKGSSHSFNALTSFSAMEITPGTISMLADRASQTLSTLRIEAADLVGDIFTPISRCYQLTDLDVTFVSLPWVTIKGSEFKKLGQLRNLEFLRLTMSPLGPNDPPGSPEIRISDADFDNTISNFPRLKKIELDLLLPNCTPQSFITLARRCPQVEQVLLPFLSLNIFKMIARGNLVVFPKVTELFFNDLVLPDTDRDSEGAEELVLGFIALIFPQLSTLDHYKGDDSWFPDLMEQCDHLVTRRTRGNDMLLDAIGEFRDKMMFEDCLS